MPRFSQGCVKTLDGRCEEQVKIDALQWFPPSVGRTRRHVEAKRSADSSESIINSAAPSFHVCLRRTCDAQCLPRHCRGLGTSIQHETSANCCSMPTRADLCMQTADRNCKGVFFEEAPMSAVIINWRRGLQTLELSSDAALVLHCIRSGACRAEFGAMCFQTLISVGL